MMARGRKSNNVPTTAYDYRRYIELVQVLAMHNASGIEALCKAWGVERVEDRSEPPYMGRYYTNVWSTIIKLAEHVIEYHREETAHD